MQHIVIKAILLVPQSNVLGTNPVRRVGDVDEVLPEFTGHVLVSRVLAGQLERNRQQIQAIHRHPTCAVRLFQVATSRQRLAAIEHTNVVESEKAAFENVVAFRVFAIDPPGEIQHQFVKDAFEKFPIGDAAPLLLDSINAPRGPRQDRWINVAERPFVRGHLTVRMHVPFAQQ